MDRIIETDDGFDFIVEGRRFGTWRSRAEAKAAMRVQQQKIADQGAADAKTIADKIDAVRSSAMSHNCTGASCTRAGCENQP